MVFILMLFNCLKLEDKWIILGNFVFYFIKRAFHVCVRVCVCVCVSCNPNDNAADFITSSKCWPLTSLLLATISPLQPPPYISTLTLSNYSRLSR